MKKSIFALSLFLTLGCNAQKASKKGSPAPAAPVDIEAIIGQMTIEEKVGQMTQINLDVVCEGGIYKLVEPHHIEPAKLQEAITKWHVGSVLNCGGHAYPLKQWHELVGEIQRVATTQGRLKIPVLYGIDAIHGANYMMGSTLFPQQLGQAATFNPELVKRGAQITAYETRAAGIPWNFSPVLDVGRNPNWSRFFETYGEDPLVCATMGRSCIQGYQGSGSYEIGGRPDATHVAACMKHFLGYSGARTGKDRTPAILSDIELRQIYMPSFQAAINEGAMSVMINSGEINGIPVHANPAILTQLLRNEMGFKGMAVTDWEDVMKLHQIHKVTANNKESVKAAVDAGIDMCMVPNDFEFARHLIELVKEGKITEARLNESVRRILVMKRDLGLFANAMPPSLKDFPDFGSAKHQQAARETAEESITLLKNDGVLPLSKNSKVLVCGPAGYSLTLINGAWTRTWQGTDAKYEDNSRHTIFEALQVINPNVTFSEGSALDSLSNVDEAVAKGRTSDVIVVCLSELPSTEKPGDIEDLRMPDAQRDLVKQLSKTGKPIVLVLVENRPRIIHDIVPLCKGIVMAYQPGDLGSDALARILFGDVNPSGKLPFTYPAHEQSLLTYDHKFSETLDPKFGNTAYSPEWPFGFGLSYSSLSYGELKLSSNELNGNGSISVSIDISNKGKFDALESVLLFTRDHVASITPSVRKLRKFDKQLIKAGSSTTYSFTLTKEDLAFINKDLKSVTEPGQFDIMIGDKVATINFLP
jgi:beta-glucosidase